MRLLHVADTHLGYSAYHKVADNGVNQREMDIYRSFERVVDWAVAHRPDLLIHAGDLFDSVRPSNRALSVALGQMLRLSEAGIPTVVIAGNHEAPKLRETGSALRIFDHLDHIYPVYRGVREDFAIGDAFVQAVPHCASAEALMENIREATPREGRINILVLHAGVTGIKEFTYVSGDFNEQVVPAGCLRHDFDYIALGHYHRATAVTGNAYYAGSTEHLSFKEAGEQKGFYEVTCDPDLRTRFVPLSVRGMVDLVRIDCANMDPPAIEQALRDAADEQTFDGAVVRVVLRNLSRATLKGLSWTDLKKRFSDALHLEISYDIFEAEHDLSGGERIGNLADEWNAFLERAPVEKSKEDLKKLALSYLSGAST
jgi:DNA repair exonuclease SbcCD nuclease subunit